MLTLESVVVDTVYANGITCHTASQQHNLEIESERAVIDSHDDDASAARGVLSIDLSTTATMTMTND